MSQSAPKAPKAPQAPKTEQGGTEGAQKTTITTTADGKVVITSNDQQGPVVAPEAPQGITTVPPQLPFDPNAGPPQGVIVLSIAFFVCTAAVIIGLPLVRAFARRMDRSGGLPAKAGASDLESAQRLARMEQAIDSIAIEVERISEGQRFTTKLLSEAPKGAPVERRVGQG